MKSRPLSPISRFARFGLFAVLGLACLSCAGGHPAGESRVPGVYRSCAVYAGAVEYGFDVAGKRVLVRVSKLEDGPQPRVPANLVEPVTDKLEGPPGANPAMVGKKFFLIYRAGKVIRVEPAGQ